MSKYDSSIDRDANFAPIGAPLPFHVSKSITFDGGTDGAIGDKDGALANFTIFEVTGDVMAWVFGVCGTSLVGAGTLEVGVTGNTAGILAQIADTTTLDENMAYHDATPALAESASFKAHIIGGGLDIKGKTTTADITAGEVTFYCFWRPLSSDGLVEAAS